MADAPPNPFNVYVGTLRVEPTKVEEPLAPVVVKLSVFCLLLNVVQSVLLKYPFVLPLDCDIEIVFPLTEIGAVPKYTPEPICENEIYVVPIVIGVEAGLQCHWVLDKVEPLLILSVASDSSDDALASADLVSINGLEPSPDCVTT